MPSSSRSWQAISTLIFTCLLGIVLEDTAVPGDFLTQFRSKMCEMCVYVTKMRGKIWGSGDIPLGFLMMSSVFIIEFIRVWYIWLVRRINPSSSAWFQLNIDHFECEHTFKTPKMILRETGLRMEAYSRNYFCFQVIKWYCNPSPVNGRIFEIDLVQHLSNLCPAMHTWNICVFSNSISWFVLASDRRMIIARWNIPYLRQGRSYHQMAAVEVTSHPHIISPLSFMTILVWYRFLIQGLCRCRFHII